MTAFLYPRKSLVDMDQQLHEQHQPPPITRSPSPTGSSEGDIHDHSKRHPSARSQRIYATQVRAFLEAAEVVDVDPDTIEDILDGFDGTVTLEDVDEDEEVETHMRQDNGQDPSEDDDEDFGLEPEYLEEGERS